jgi:hypothetical protein
MLCIVTTIHDPTSLATTCRQLGLAPPKEGSVQLDQGPVFGWIVRLPGLHAPLVFDTLTGRVAYHARDNAFEPYERIMRFILRCYDVRALSGRSSVPSSNQRNGCHRRRGPVEEVA